MEVAGSNPVPATNHEKFLDPIRRMERRINWYYQQTGKFPKELNVPWELVDKIGEISLANQRFTSNVKSGLGISDLYYKGIKLVGIS